MQDLRCKIQVKKIQNLKTCNLQPATCNSHRGGFTLLEIMISLAIIGTVLIAVFNTVNYHADVVYNDTVTTQMFLAAREKITEMEMEMETNPESMAGVIPETDFKFENSVKKTEDEKIINLETIVSSKNRKVVLSELVIKK